MHGNFAQWTGDWYRSDYESDILVDDPIGPGSGERRVIRGGTWRRPAVDCRSAFRGQYFPDKWGIDLGFRVVCEVPAKPSEEPKPGKPGEQDVVAVKRLLV